MDDCLDDQNAGNDIIWRIRAAKKSHVFCSVRGCNSTPRKHPDVSFHSFPLGRGGTRQVLLNNGHEFVQTTLLEAWKQRLHFEKPPTKFMKVCSKHFKDDDYHTQRLDGERRRLRAKSIPSLHLPSISVSFVSQENPGTASERVETPVSGAVNAENNIIWPVRAAKKSHVFCSVKGCRSTPRKDPDVSFHSFPLSGSGTRQVLLKNGYRFVQTTLLEAWKQRLRFERPPTKYMKVCSKHFKEDDYHIQRLDGERRRLRAQSIPSLHLPSVRVPFVRRKSPGASERVETPVSGAVKKAMLFKFELPMKDPPDLKFEVESFDSDSAGSENSAMPSSSTTISSTANSSDSRKK